MQGCDRIRKVVSCSGLCCGLLVFLVRLWKIFNAFGGFYWPYGCSVEVYEHHCQ